MTISNWIILLSAIIVTVGWFVTSRLDRKNDIAVMRSKYRMEAYEKWVDFFLCAQEENNPEYKGILYDKFIDARLYIFLYGQADEYKLIEELKEMCMIKNNALDRTHKVNEIHRLVLDRIRIELGNSKIPL